MKKFLAAALAALLSLGLLPAVTAPARMLDGGDVVTDVSTAYVGDTVRAYAYDLIGMGMNADTYFSVFRNGMLEFHGPQNAGQAFSFQPAGAGRFTVRYAVVVQFGSQDFRYSAPVTVVARPAPKNVKAEAVNGTSLKVTWDAVPGATGYQVFRSESRDGTYAFVKATASASWTSTYLAPGKLYYFKVRATNNITLNEPYGTIVSSNYSAPAAGIPLAKAAIQSATATGKDRVKLVLTPVPGASGYEVQVSSTAGGAYRVLRRVSAATFTITGLNPDTAYYFKVRAYRTVSAGTFFGPLSGYKGVRTLK